MMVICFLKTIAEDDSLNSYWLPSPRHLRLCTPVHTLWPYRRHPRHAGASQRVPRTARTRTI